MAIGDDENVKKPWRSRVLGFAAVFWLVCTGLVLLRYYNYYPTYAAFDQGIFGQVFWNNLHGRWFESSLSSTLSTQVVHDSQPPDVGYRRLGQHFTPALLVWLPFYAVFSSPAGLSVLQVTIVTAAGLVLYALARHYHPPQLSGWIAGSFYAANAVLGPTIANFHDLCQIPLYIFGLLLAMERRAWWLFGGLAILTLLVREDAGVVLFSVGMYLVLSRRHPRLGLAVCVVSFGYMLALTTWVMPLFSADVSRRFTVEQFGQYVDGNEATTIDVIKGILSKPWRLLAELVSPIDVTIKYFLAQWLPLAFVPALSPSAWVLAGFPLLKNMMSQDITALSIDLRYAITIVPGLFYGAILWWAKHRDRFQPRIRRLWLLCLGVALVLTIISNPNRALSFAIPDSFVPWVYTSPARQWQHAQVIRSFLRQIPPDASVSATTYIVPHVSNRRELVRFPIMRLQNDEQQVIQVEYVVVDLWQLVQYQEAFKDDRERLQSMVPIVDRLLQRRYGLVDFQDGVVFLQRKTNHNSRSKTNHNSQRKTDYNPQRKTDFSSAALLDWNAYKHELQPILQRK